ncbi:NADH-ubiquinone oxidoreductase-F iron-sulfur binding region domain-containing protein [Pseudarthrobacter niigatensis]|uniref:NADH:ubiquinone oxidoreductase subunit F (NADH-binding) n=1 Tax=Pseudarthrobacter niigatensis TaxID=369935 RepID=A0AAJ1WDM4_9MICC|nr:NADH-ubiquinone oxidoreductase-F iron-sulfur binding region domain-containing protein [Pseudarthrobacter niigatensis]MDQ0146339.1 NADH:ubiquinone oxidoreductase subunit F (NADH-binding) [Pseudarthrobacter niigatensis]MDQ0264889.1 NADH:ubiquinone oxidoreductase subunit F (NADH-binding) [Pseudarthrobacter niigatensis]
MTHPHDTHQPVPLHAEQDSLRQQPRLLAAGPGAGWSQHLEAFGPWEAQAAGPGLLDTLAAAGLTGRGGAAFETWRKASAAAGSGRKGMFAARPVVIANGAEGEPLSFKDRTLLAHAPHLVIDGLVALAEALGGASMYMYAPAASLPRVEQAVGERPRGKRIRMVQAPETFISGESSAVVNMIANGSAIPTDQRPRLSESGLNGRPTLVVNVETLAQVALIARYGAPWFRQAGTPADPGTRLVSVSGPAPVPDVVLEVPGGAQLSAVLQEAGMDPAALSAVLVGGYHGRWVRPAAHALSPAGLPGRTVRPGAGVIHALDLQACGIQATARIVGYLADQSARQCGPCMFGLPAMASILNRIAGGETNHRLASELDRLGKLVSGRGACRHPEGTAGLVGSALEVFAGDFRAHLSGYCTGPGGAAA